MAERFQDTQQITACGGSVMLWPMICWETIGPAIYVDDTLRHTTHLNISAGQVHDFMVTVFLFQHKMCPATLQKMLSNGLNNMTNPKSQSN